MSFVRRSLLGLVVAASAMTLVAPTAQAAVDPAKINRIANEIIQNPAAERRYASKLTAEEKRAVGRRIAARLDSATAVAVRDARRQLTADAQRQASTARYAICSNAYREGSSNYGPVSMRLSMNTRWCGDNKGHVSVVFMRTDMNISGAPFVRTEWITQQRRFINGNRSARIMDHWDIVVDIFGYTTRRDACPQMHVRGAHPDLPPNPVSGAWPDNCSLA